MKNLSTIIIVILAIAIIYLLYVNRKYAGKTCFDLPTNDPNWGNKYWYAIHSIADRIPCSMCHDDGVSLFKFSHDLVNLKTKKPLFFPDNFSMWKKYISNINDDGTFISTDSELSATVAPSK